MEKLKQYLTRQNLIIASAIIIVLLLLALMYNVNTNHAEELRKVKILTAEQATNINALQNRLKVSEEQAEKLTEKIAEVQSNKVQPVSYITVTAPSIERATADVQERIDRKDPTLPPEALENSDRTVVTPQPDNDDYQVGIYKINLDKNNRIKAGFTHIDDKTYYALAYERERLEITLHSKNLRQVDGVTLMYTVAKF